MFRRHAVERIVDAGQVVLESAQRVDDDPLDVASLRPTDGRRQAEAADAASGSDAARPDVLLVQRTANQLSGRN